MAFIHSHLDIPDEGGQYGPEYPIEHFVRAGEVLIPELLNDTAMSESTLELYTNERSFIYLPFIVDRLRACRIEEGLSYELSIRNTMEDLKNEYLP